MLARTYYLRGPFLVDLILLFILFIQFLIATDQARYLIIPVIAGPLEPLILPNKLRYVGITLMYLHLQGIQILPQL